MSQAIRALYGNFLGHAPDWYKQTLITFLVINPLLVHFDAYAAGWLLIAEFIFTLSMALKCYPLQPGGLLAIEAVVIGLVTPETVYSEVSGNLDVILLLIFMVAGIYFLKDLLLHVFTRILLGIESKVLLSLFFCFTAAVLSAFLDALTVTAVIVTVAVGFYAVYHRVASGKSYTTDHDSAEDAQIHELHRSDLEQFRAFMRSLLMHGAVGTALGGVCTQVGEPQNLIIASKAGWNFVQFFLVMAPVSLPVFAAGLLTCAVLEKTRILGFGAPLPGTVREILTEYAQYEDHKSTPGTNAALITQGIVALLLVVALAFHVAEVGLIGLMVVVLASTFNGVIEEHRIGLAFEEALPFTSLLVVFFAVVGVIHQQQLFEGIIHWVLGMDPERQPGMFFIANGVLSMISDNVFVATVYIGEVAKALQHGLISPQQFQRLAIAINAGTNLPSVATPNGQAAFLFLLTSAIAPLIRLSYGRMVLMALPYTLVLGGVGYLLVEFAT